MSNDFDIDFDFQSGFAPEDMEDTLDTLLRETNSEVKSAVQTVTLATEADVRRRAPVGPTGNLRASYESEVETSRDSITGYVGTNTEYAPYVEFGTVKMGAQPHLRPAIDTVMRQYEPEVVEAVYSAIRSAQR